MQRTRKRSSRRELDDGEAIVRRGDAAVRLRVDVAPTPLSRLRVVVLDIFRDMGATPVELEEASRLLETDRSFHEDWIVDLPTWCPSVAVFEACAEEQ